MLAADTVLDGEALARILRMGHSRVPVHRPGHRTHLLGVVLVKELVLLDPDDRVSFPILMLLFLIHLLVTQLDCLLACDPDAFTWQA